MRIRKTPSRAGAAKHRLTDAQLDHFRQMLLRDRAALLHALEPGMATPPDSGDAAGDQTDRASTETERDLIALNRARATALLGRVEQALGRIDAGTYGVCEDTGAPIDLDRLEAQPTATLSLAAQRRREQMAAPGQDA